MHICERWLRSLCNTAVLEIVSGMENKDCCCCLVAKSSPAFCDPLDSSMTGFPVVHYLPEFVQTHVHCVKDAVQPSHPLLPSSPPALNLSQHQGLFQQVGSSHQVAKVLKLQLQKSILPMNI